MSKNQLLARTWNITSSKILHWRLPLLTSLWITSISSSKIFYRLSHF